MRWLMLGCWSTIVIPLLWCGIRMMPAARVASLKSSRYVKVAVLLLWIMGGFFLLSRPHDDSFAGLDSLAYREMSHAFLAGRPMHGKDPVMSSVPQKLRRHFLFKTGRSLRPTRDLVFQLKSPDLVDSKPFFSPFLPLAAGALSPLVAPERFLPLLGVIWLGIMLSAGLILGGGWGVATAVVLVLGSAWPAWFMRGFHVEAAGAVLVSAIIISATVRAYSKRELLVAGFTLGISVCCHPLLILVCLPVGLALIIEQPGRHTTIAMAAGVCAGLFPFWAFTRWVCQPYGDWTRWESLGVIAFSCPEHCAMAAGLLISGLLAIVALTLLNVPSIREKFRKLDRLAVPWGWGVLFAIPFLLCVLWPGETGGIFRKGVLSVWSGIRLPYGLWLLMGAVAALGAARRFRERFLVTALAWAMLLFFFIQGTETPVGLWSQRRFISIIMVLAALLLAPLSSWLSACRPGNSIAGKLLYLFVCLAAGTNLMRWPTAYATVTHAGARDWIRESRKGIPQDSLTVFDYFPHSVPGAATLQRSLLGLGEHAHEDWPAVVGWLQDRVQTQEVWLVSSWTPARLEEGFRLQSYSVVTGVFPVVQTRKFFPAVSAEHRVRNHIMRIVPLNENDQAEQKIEFDGSPLALRGKWQNLRNGGAWSRSDSGMIGPVPPVGKEADLVIDCEWFPPVPEWDRQTLRVLPPWGGAELTFDVKAGPQRLKGRLKRPPAEVSPAPTGVYKVMVERPYNPAEFGMRGYADDLGVVFRHVMISVSGGEGEQEQEVQLSP